MEQIYTIPVHEAFEKSRDDAACGCPLCTLFNQLQENELDLILGASLMEPDIRIRTNAQGFCATHYDMMFHGKNRLGLALILQSHLDELARDLPMDGPTPLMAGRGAAQARRLGELAHSCYLCGRIEFHFAHIISTTVLLWDVEETFPALLKAQPYFCLPHYRRMLDYAQKKLSKKKFAHFTADLGEVQKSYFEKLQNDVDWFCRKFDYRYEEEPWYDAKDAVERTIRFLTSAEER